MKELIVIFIGSGFGGISRYGLSKLVNNFHTFSFPFGTFIVNLVACFILGITIGLVDQKNLLPPTSKLFLTVGFCGGFSTFSTFSNETLQLFQQGNFLTAFLYVFFSIFVCILSLFFGLLLVGRV